MCMKRSARDMNVSGASAFRCYAESVLLMPSLSTSCEAYFNYMHEGDVKKRYHASLHACAIGHMSCAICADRAISDVDE